MMGDYLLVAPMFAGEQSRSVTLPAGKWYDFYTGELVGEGEVIEITPGLDKIPLFVKNGGIIPMTKASLQMPGPDEKRSLTVRHYGTGEGAFELYDDDGVSFDFEQGQCSRSELKVSRVNNKLEGNMTTDKPDAFHYENQVNWIFMSKE